MSDTASIRRLPLATWSWSQSHQVTLGLLFTLGSATVLRLASLTYGLPYLYNSDEWYQVLPALHIAQTGDLHPGRLDYGSAYIYLLAAIFRLAAWLGLVPHLDHMPLVDVNVRPETFAEPAFFVLGRLVTVVVSLLGVWATYRIGRRLFDAPTGLLAAALLAVSPTVTSLSRFTLTDPPALTMSILCLWAALHLYEGVTWRRAILASLLVGVASSFKYPIALLALPVMLAHLLARQRPSGWAPSLVAPILLPIGFLLTTPYALLDIAMFYSFLDHHRGINTWPPSGVVEGPSGPWYVQYLLWRGEGILLASGVSAILLWRKAPAIALIVVSFPIAYTGLLLLSRMRYDRYLLPILPYLSLLAAWLVIRLVYTLRERWPYVAWAPIGLALILPLTVTLTQLSYLYQPDTRAVAAAWIQANLPDQDIVTDRFGPNMDASLPRMVRADVFEHPPRWYAEHNMVVAISNINWLQPGRTGEEQHALDAFEANTSLEMITQIEGHMWGLPEYVIRIYQPRVPTHR